MATNQVASLGIKVSAHGVEKAKSGIRGIGNVAKRVKDQIFSLNGAMGALGAGALMKSVIKSASGLESLRVRLKFLTGSTKDAGKAFDTMTGFASKVPFALEDIQKASPLLLTVTDDIDELNGLLEMTGDIAAVSGLDFVKTAEQLQRAMASGMASADLFRERGVASFLGFEAGVTYTAKQTTDRLKEMWENNTSTAVGATTELAKTFQGQVSMMEDAWFKLKIQFADSGIFELAKDNVLAITEALGKPATLAKVKDFGKALVSFAKVLGGIVETFMGLPPYVREVGLIMAFLGGMKGKLVLAGLLALSKGIDMVRDALIGASKAGGIKIDVIGNAKKEIERHQINLARVQKQIEDINSGKTKVAGGKKGAERMLAAYREAITFIENDLIRLGHIIGGTSLDPVKPTVEANVKDEIMTKATADIDKYISKLKTVGIEETKRQTLKREIDVEIKRIWASEKTSLEQKVGLVKQVTGAYTQALGRMDELDIAKKVQALTDSMSDSITSMIMNIGQGTNSLKDSVKGMVKIILAEFIKIKVAQPIANSMASNFNWASMFREHGGTVTGNKPYVVGEAGPEVFLPNKTGTIIPNNEMSMGSKSGGESSVNVNFNITANDTTGFDDLLDSRRGMIVGIINQAMNDRGITGVTA